MTTKRATAHDLWAEIKTVAARVALPFLGIGVLVVLLGLLLTKVADQSAFSDADTWLNRWLEDRRTGTLNTITHYGTLFGETPTIVGLTAITAAAFRLAYSRWRESVILVFCVSSQALIFLITTILIDRTRPHVQHLDESPPTSSFPSGHTAASTAFYLGTALIVAWHLRELWLKRVVVVVGVLIPLIVASCRMYRGMHYPTDVTTSFLLGCSLLAVALTLVPLRDGDRVGAPART